MNSGKRQGWVKGKCNTGLRASGFPLSASEAHWRGLSLTVDFGPSTYALGISRSLIFLSWVSRTKGADLQIATGNR